jgi:hypothetical protein
VPKDPESLIHIDVYVAPMTTEVEEQSGERRLPVDQEVKDVRVDLSWSHVPTLRTSSTFGTSHAESHRHE